MNKNTIILLGNVRNSQIQQETTDSSQESQNEVSEPQEKSSSIKQGSETESTKVTDLGIINPKVFISYSWSSEEYKSVVLQLAEDLRRDGVDVILDRWDLRAGQDKYYFMEHSVQAANKVLILCDSKYMEKANNRTGGVGDETAIITPDVYGNNEQEKFIPVLMEGKDVVPKYLKGRIGVDLTPGDRKKKYKELLRVIFEKPIYQKPVLGQPPKWLDAPMLDTRQNLLDEG